MSLWTIKKRWYTPMQWVMRRSLGLFLVGVMMFGPGFPFAAFAGDNFVGDSAIYIGDPASRPRPKILFLIDNSQSTMASASGSRYYPGVLYPDNGYEPEDIYRAKTTGDGYLLTFDNDSYALEELASDACVDIVRNALLTTGLYAGSGTTSAPNLTSLGGCDSTAPSGVVYTLGNFLNYTQFVTNGDDDLDTVADDDDICRGHMDDFSTTKTYAEVQTIYNTAGVSMPSYLPATDVLFYDMDEDGVPNGLFPGTPWEDGCDICPGYPDYEDLDGDDIPDGCDEDDDGDSVPDTEDICYDGNDTIDWDEDGIPDDCDDLIDSDGDGIADSEDNCINIVNSDQANVDGDSFGDVCDIDADEDLILNDDDNCPLVYNPGQENADGDAYVEGDDTTGGDACDTDDDNDGTPDTLDICPGFSDDVKIDVAPADGVPDNDLDEDGKPDGCDASVDSDGDGVTNAVDNCPTDSNPHQEDNDGDGDGDACDLDDDNDSIPDVSDKCPMLASADNTDTDGDGQGNPCDDDDDGDGVLDSYDICPLGKNTDDVDGDLVPDLCDTKTDTDGDGIDDGADNCKSVINPNQADADTDGIGDICDPDDDNDSVPDTSDVCHGANDKDDADGDGIPDACDNLQDADKDGVPDSSDDCPGQDDRIDVDKDSVPDCTGDFIDSDADGITDSADQCAGFDDNIDVDVDGTPDGCDAIVDSDGDNAPDSADKCPGFDDATDVDEDGLPDKCDSLIDSDRDGVADLNDQCKGLVGDPLTPATDDRIDADLDGVPDCTGDPVDTDRDGESDATDLCPGYDDSIDVDDDGKPDGCDTLIDSDKDGVADAVDQCPGVNDDEDIDEDKIPDCKDALVDADKDGFEDRYGEDKCLGQDDRVDVDRDGIPDCTGDLIDSDWDNVADVDDKCPGFPDFGDLDNDGIPDLCDKCQGFPDSDDSDGDGVPDKCDKGTDSDGDTVPDKEDICPFGSDFIDSDGDTIPDACDPIPNDKDNDGTQDDSDKCPGYDDFLDADKDGIPDGCDNLTDSDNDTIPDDEDTCPNYNDLIDVDEDGLPDACDPLIDSDEDGIADSVDQCKGPAGVSLIPAYDDRIDADMDGVLDCTGDLVDSDFDGVEDSKDVCAGKNDQIDADKDSTPDCNDSLIDSDRDLVADSKDQCPGPVGGPLTDQYDDRIDVDKDLIPDCSDTIIDTDEDGVADADDVCKGPAGTSLIPAYDDRIDVDKDSIPDCKVGEVVDSDHDGVADSAPDKCPGFDDNIDIDKDGTPDGCDDIVDSDKDGVADVDDQCPGENDKTDVDQDGIPDGCDILIDSDRDDVADTDDKCEGPVGGPLTAVFDDRIDVDKDNIPDCSDPKIDSDHDTLADDVDNCPTMHNTDQTNTDGDKYVFASPQMTGGDACDVDDDGDNVLDTSDNCPLSPSLSADQTDVDNDGVGDICDPLVDTDGDTVADDTDNCKDISNTNQSDADSDGVGDVCDTDDDNDGEPDTTDKCQGYPDGVDVDKDGIPDGCDDFVDTDKDGVEDANDNCLNVANASQLDTDYDGAGDACDGDDDGDDIADGSDNCPLSYGKSADQTNTDAASGDTQGDVCDTDDDGDGSLDNEDNCPLAYGLPANQLDFDNDGVGDGCDSDIDGDDVPNGSDLCPNYDDALKDTDGDDKVDCGTWVNIAYDDQCEGDDAICGCTAANYPPYDELIVEVVNPKTNQVPWTDVSSGDSSRYRLTQKHTSEAPTYEYITNEQGDEELKVGGNKPGWSDNWRQYWETVPDDTPLTPTPDGGWEAGKQFWLPSEYPCPTGASLESESVPIASVNPQADDLSWLLSLSQAMPTLTVAAASVMTFFSLTGEEAEAATQRAVIFDAIDMVVSSAYNSAHFGAMTYGSSPEKGGRIVREIQELSKTEVDDWLSYLPGGEVIPDTNNAAATLNSNALRPQATAIYDAGYYFGAGYDPVNASQMSGQTFTSTDGNCGYNHIILITNGLPNESTLSPMDTTINGEDDGDNIDETIYAQGTHYSDDVAYYLNKTVDLTPENKRVGKDITVHTVLAFAPEDELIERTAAMGGGEFYHAYNANQLAEALQNLLVRIVAEEDTAFVAPVVPASTTNRTISSDRVYLGLFKPQIDEAWIGNIKKYRVSQGTQLLDGKTPPEPATDPDTGDFIEKSNSYWGTIDENGDTVPDKIKCSDGEKLYASGDGGLANCGGVGGTLAARNLLDDSPTELYTGVRNIYTYPSSSNPKDLTHAMNRWPTFTTNNPISNALISTAVLDVSTSDEREDVLRFVQGFDIKDTNPDAQRSWLLGDILHSRPVVFNYSSYTPDQENDCSLNTSVIYVGANDGMIHAFRDCDGREVWAFIPPHVLPGLKDGLDGTHQYFVDSPPVAFVHDTNSNGIIEATTDPTVDQTGDRVVLIFGLRRGGSTNDVSSTSPWGGYFAIDVSNRDKPVLLFSVDSSTTGLEAMGQSWSQPRLSKVKVGGLDKVVAFVAGGYDKYEDLRFGQTQEFPTLGTDTIVPEQVYDSGVSIFSAGATSTGGVAAGSSPYTSTGAMRGAGMYAIEIATLTGTVPNLVPDTSSAGNIVWSYDYGATKSAGKDPNMLYSIASDMTLGDLDGDSYADVIYVGDAGGRMWRFDVSEIDPNLWDGNIIFDTNPGYEEFYTPYNGTNDRSKLTTPTVDDSDVGRKIFYKPAVSVINNKPTLWFGTGDRAHPLNQAVVDRLYMVVDDGQTTVSGINEKNLVDLTDDPLQSSKYDVLNILSKLNPLAKGPYNEPDYYYGWMIKMNYDYENDQSSSVVGEKMLAAPVMFNNEAFFTTYAPLEDPSAGNPCAVGNLGTSKLYQLSSKTGEAIYNYDVSNDSDTLEENSRAQSEDGKVLKRSDRVRSLGQGIPSGIVTLIDASGKVTMMISSSNRVETTSGIDVKTYAPLYWMQW